MAEILVWGYALQSEWLSPDESDYLKQLPSARPSVEWVWSEMDRVWEMFGLDNTAPLRGQPVDVFYRHPVWLLNGIFTAVDPDSHAHRLSIAACLGDRRVCTVADFGGGFGELAREIAQLLPNARVLLVEPFPTRVCSERSKNWTNLSVVSALGDQRCDAVVAQDVLEHVEDPVGLAFLLVSNLDKGGLIVFANCFYPVIHCHLPSTFHLRHTFPWVMRALGLRLIKAVPGAPHAQLFERIGEPKLSRARRAEQMSSLIGGALNILWPILSRLKRQIFKS